MAKQKRKLLRPHGDLIMYLVKVILRWEKDELVKKMKLKPRSVDNILAPSAKYSMRSAT